MRLNLVRQKLNVHRVMSRKIGVQEKDIECYVEIDGERRPVEFVDLRVEEHNRFKITFRG